MSDGLLGKHNHLHAGTIAASAEELDQKYQKLLDDYSKLKAKHTILKKAVIKEQSKTASLQGNVKEKEKELRKLQEQLDLLAFHNERLTKRIEAVQENKTKGSHFSLLGGAVKKELERSTRALDAASLDLAKKIEENERLHEELSENHHIYTDHVKGLHTQIAELEKRVEELQLEISALQKDRRDQTGALKQEKSDLQAEIDHLKLELAEKTRLLDENERHMKQSDMDLRSEIESLRAILLAKAGDLESQQQQQKETMPKLSEVIPACDALKMLEDQARSYIHALREQTPLKGLPHEIAAKLKISSETWSEEVSRLARRLEESEAQTKELLEAKRKGEDVSTQHQQRISELESTIESLKTEFDRQQQEKLDRTNQLEEQNKILENQMKEKEAELDATRKMLEALREEQSKKGMSMDQEIQTDLPVPEQSPKEEEEEEEETFVYPVNDAKSLKNNHNTNDYEEEEDEVFVYRGEDSPDTKKANGTSLTNGSATQQTNGVSGSVDKWKEEMAMLQAYYETQIRQLSEKLQFADSKAVRFSKMVESLKERVAAEKETNQKLCQEKEQLQKDIVKLEDLRATTERNYQQSLQELANELARRDMNQARKSVQY